LICADDGFGSGALHESARLRVEDGAEEIVRRRIAYFAPDGWIEFNQFHQIRFPKFAGFRWRLRGQGLFHQLRDRPDGFDSQLVATLRFDLPAFTYVTFDGDLRRPPNAIPSKDKLLPRVRTLRGKTENVL